MTRTVHSSLLKSSSSKGRRRRLRRDKRERSIQKLAQDIQLQLEQEEQARYQQELEVAAQTNDSVDAASTVTRMSAEQIQVRKMKVSAGRCCRSCLRNLSPINRMACILSTFARPTPKLW